LQKKDFETIFTNPGTTNVVIAAMKPLAWTTSSLDLNLGPVIEIILCPLAVGAMHLRPAPKWKIGINNKIFLHKLGWIQLNLG
jgi:hypothetical protein